jgi:hypothetical protein
VVYAFLLVSGLLAGCDSVQPERTGSLVVETFMMSGEPPSDVVLRRTLPLDETRESGNTAAARGALVEVSIGEDLVRFEENSPGRYATPGEFDRVLEAGDPFRLRVEWEGAVATASGRIPPEIRLDSIVAVVPSEPVEAILVDSLRLDTLGVDATTGFIYPVETTVWWSRADAYPADTWIHAQLRPQNDFSSVVVDFFLLPEQVFREADAELSFAGNIGWTGLYAIPVDREDEPLPTHTLRVALVRSDDAYADYAVGRFDADGREPPSNVDGALGVAVGVSVDSVLVEIGQDVIGRKSLVYRR